MYVDLMGCGWLSVCRCFGDMVEAERRWRLTKQWRVEFNTDDILEQEHPYFDDIKKVPNTLRRTWPGSVTHGSK